jgi:predicted acylesterase/phospholipase RssA
MELISDEILSEYDTLVLSGGSSKGIIILGSLQYAYDNFLLTKITNYVGTSAGAIICYLLAIGFTPIEIVVYICTNQLLEKIQHFNIVAMINGVGAISFNNIYEHLEKMTIEKLGYIPTFLDLKEKYSKNLVCVTYNITEDKTEYLSHENYPNLPCLIGLRMSSNLPLIFENYKYGNSFYIDGGITDNFAIDIGDKIGKKVLGVLIASDSENFNTKPDSSILEFIYKLIFIPISQILEYKLKHISDKCKIIKLCYDKIKFFDFNINSKTKLDFFSFGYENMKKEFENLN